MRKKFTEEEEVFLRGWYAARKGAPLCIDELATLMKRSRWSIAMRASRLGLCEQSRPFTDTHIQNCVTAQKGIGQRPEVVEKRRRDKKKWHAEHDHPRGMLGKTHAPKARDAISAANKGRVKPEAETRKMIDTKLKRYGTLAVKVKRGSWRAGWRVIGGARSFYRSTWEANFARHLEALKMMGQIVKWEHEPDVFTFPGVGTRCSSYTPDFRITHFGDSVQYAEIKGWNDSDSILKIQRMGEFHPKVWFTVFDKKWFSENARSLAKQIPDWEK